MLAIYFVRNKKERQLVSYPSLVPFIVQFEGRNQQVHFIYIANVILFLVIRNFFVQHEFQISEQLSEVHKLMSISSDEDLLAHLQNQNFELHQELNQLKYEQQQKRNVTSTLFLARNHFAAATAIHGRHQTRFFHRFNQPRRPVVADAQMPLNQ